MRPIANNALAQRYAASQSVAWLLTLDAGSWQWRGATQAVTLDGNAYPARLTLEHWREELPQEDRPGGLARARAELRLLDDAADVLSLQGRLAVTPPIGIRAVLQLVWLTGAGLTGADAAVMLQGRVAEWRADPPGVRLVLVDELQAQSARRVGRLLQPRLIPGDTSPSFGKLLPWVFGHVADAELLPLRTGVTGLLAQTLGPADTVVPLVSLDGFPPQGRVQIGGEQIGYTTLDKVKLTLGAIGQPVSRGPAPVTCTAGTTVRQVPRVGFQWVVADHACRLVESVRADGLPVPAANWSTTLANLGGSNAQVVTMARWPVDAEGREARQITASVQGLMDGLGNLAENPADVIRCLLTNSRLAGLDAGWIDENAFAVARSALAIRGYRFARRLAGEETLGELLTGAAQEGSVWIGAGHPIRLLLVDPSPHAERVEEELDETVMLDPLRPARVNAPDGFIPPDAVELTGAAQSQGLGRPSYQFPPESVFSGAIPRRFAADWVDLTVQKAAGDLGECTWAHLGEPPFEVEPDFPIGAALLAAGETVGVSSGPLDLSEALAWVRAIEVGAPGAARPAARAQLTLRGPWAGEYYWKMDRRNYIRRHAFGGHVVLVLDGVPVARLSRGGTLRIAGRLREQATLTAGPFSGPVTVYGGWLYLNCLTNGLYWPCLRLDRLGNAELAGTVRERSVRAWVTNGRGLGSDPGRFWLSSDAVSGGMEFITTEHRLHLREILIESIRL